MARRKLLLTGERLRAYRRNLTVVWTLLLAPVVGVVVVAIVYRNDTHTVAAWSVRIVLAACALQLVWIIGLLIARQATWQLLDKEQQATGKSRE
ncbi:MAG: hypothetical protein JWN82_482 [Candidatus Saccharibacteria bacterium]|nr:hypothetical protein [Candidatus Saccharibacteria bacterium]